MQTETMDAFERMKVLTVKNDSTAGIKNLVGNARRTGGRRVYESTKS